MKSAILILAFILVNGVLLSQGTKNQIVYFATNSAELNGSEKEKLNQFFDLFDKSKITEIKLLGHTDSDGEDGFNNRLSENRSKSVRRFLLIHGLKSSNEESFGEKKPVNSNSTEEEKSRNRRVEVIVSYAKGGLLSENDFKVLAYRNLPTSEYCIDPKRDTILKLIRGGRVIFKANTFDSDGGCVTIYAKEAYKKSEIILANLSTTSNGNLLESGGMMYLEARNSVGEELPSQKVFTVQMPTDNYLDSMMIFNGDHRPDSSLNWTQPEEGISDAEMLANCWDDAGNYKWKKITRQDTILETVLNCEECKFFPCRIKRIGTFLGGATDAKQRVANREFRDCQKKLKKSNKKKSVSDTEKVVDKSYYEVLPSDSIHINSECEELKRQLDSLGYSNYSEYYAFKMKEKREKTIQSLKAGTASFDDVKAYSMQSTRMGWINCDRFISMPPKSKIRTFVPVNNETEDLRNAQCTIVLQDRTSLIGSNPEGKGFRFIDLPKGLSIFVLAVLMKNGKIFLSIDKTNVQNSIPMPQFKEVSYDELVRRLQILD